MQKCWLNGLKTKITLRISKIQSAINCCTFPHEFGLWDKVQNGKKAHPPPCFDISFLETGSNHFDFC